MFLFFIPDGMIKLQKNKAITPNEGGIGMHRIQWKKIVCMVVAVFMLGSLFVGCGSEKAAEPAKSEPAAETAKKEETPKTEAPAAKKPEDYKATLTAWGWDENYWKTVTAAFNQKYPNIKFEYTPMANGDSVQKYQTAIAAGTELPDIAWAIIDSRAKLFELDMWEPLNKAPYNFDINQVFDYLKPVMVNSKGDVCGIEQSVCPAGLAYRRDLAKQYLGTDDPVELAKMLPTWDAFIEKGKEVKEKSGGKVFMWPGMGDAEQFIREQDASPWVENGKIMATKSLKRTLDLIVRFRDAGIVDKLDAWSPAWYASYGEGKHMFAGCATWTSQFVIQPNDKDGKGQGHWGLMNVPEGNINWGGTTLGISKTCKDKEAAWEFVKFATLSKEGAEAIKTIGNFTSAKEPYKDPNFASFKDEWFGGQDTGKFFIEQVVPQIKLRPMTIDDNVIHDAMILVTTALNSNSKMTSDEALKKLIEEIKTKLPDAQVE